MQPAPARSYTDPATGRRKPDAPAGWPFGTVPAPRPSKYHAATKLGPALF